MEEPTLAFQRAVIATLRAAPGVAALVSTRIYDRVPPDAVMPYIRIGDDRVVSDAADCFGRAVELATTIHVYSAATGKVEAKRVCGAIVDSLTDTTLSLAPDWSMDDLMHSRSIYFDEPDGLTTHGVVDFRAYLEPA